MSSKDVERFLAGLINIKIQPARSYRLSLGVCVCGGVSFALTCSPSTALNCVNTHKSGVGALRDRMKNLGLCIRKD